MSPRDTAAAWIGVLSLAFAYFALPLRAVFVGLAERIWGKP